MIIVVSLGRRKIEVDWHDGMTAGEALEAAGVSWNENTTVRSGGNELAEDDQVADDTILVVGKAPKGGAHPLA